ncbi:MAG TPA: DUF6134 family protein [Planctomycetaceae bacterium]|jgi:hypothetical protein|nr:DUF6134 family protein [Planctomycetaceae bacterium]
MAPPHARNVVSGRSATAVVIAWVIALCGCGAFEFCAALPVRAAEPVRNIEAQRRQFTISVDGTNRGTCTMQIRRRSDGTTWMRSEAEIRINYLVYRYNYTSSGTEVWKNGRLLGMKNVSDYNGTQYQVKAAATAKSLEVTVDGTVSKVPPDAWLSSYWQSPERLAEGELADRTAGETSAATDRDANGVRLLSIVDSDQGRLIRGKLVRVRDETLNVAGEQKACSHYHITGDVNVDLWYDASGRMVQQESVERRHKVRFELTEIAAE